MTETAVAILTSLALVGGFVLEWRRAGAAERIAELEQRLALVEERAATQHLEAERLAAVEAALERLRRNL